MFRHAWPVGSLIVALALSAAGAGCGLVPVGGGPIPDVPLKRIGPDRGAAGYEERFPEAKAALLAVINRERRAAGAPPVAYDLLGAQVGDAFCADAAARNSVGHWDLDGRAPYLRWALAGGIDPNGENFAAETRVGLGYHEPMADQLLAMHARFMAERPPDDGHRRTVLDPTWTHVGIGAAVDGTEFRMTEEFSRRVVEWVEVPAWPVRAGSVVEVTLKLRKGWSITAVDVCPEKPPRPISRAEAKRRGAYSYPPPVETLRPFAPPGGTWSDGSRGTFDASPGGKVSFRVKLRDGPGAYFLQVFGGEGNVFGRPLSPIAVPMVRAE